MDFKETYTSTSEKDNPKETGKKVLTDDAYAIGNLLDKLNDVLEKLRLSWLSH